jgi:DNA replication and repair protein RecF
VITQIKLNNFRKFKSQTFDIDSNLVIIHGDNAKGKSSILEALYVVTNGRSPWNNNNDIFNNEEKEPYFRVEITDEEKTYALYKDEKKRQLQIDSSNTIPKKFFQTASTIFSPEQIELLMISPSRRRGFIDDLISKVDREFEDNLTKYRKVLRQRNAYLKKLAKKFYESGEINEDDTQLKYWTEELVKLSTKIIAQRSRTIEELKNDDFRLKYKSSLRLNLFEDMAKDEELKDAHMNLTLKSLRKDVATGYTNLGAHRDDWDIYNGQDIKRFGSRGQKRVAIGHLVFSSQEYLKDSLDYYPILLLDDIPSELDVENTKHILDRKNLERQQTFLTTIDIHSVPDEIQSISQIIDLNQL